MIPAKTADGFEIELDENVLDDAELLDALGGMEDGDVFDMGRLTQRLLGKAGRKKLYDHLRTPEGRVPVAAVATALGELLNSFTAGKKLCILAELIASDEDALICDFAQYYHVLGWRTLPLRLAATLASGLPGESRSMLKLRGLRISNETQLLASVADSLHRLEWRLFGQEGSTMPPSILAGLMELPEQDGGDVQSYDSPEEFEAAVAALKGG